MFVCVCVCVGACVCVCVRVCVCVGREIRKEKEEKEKTKGPKGPRNRHTLSSYNHLNAILSSICVNQPISNSNTYSAQTLASYLVFGG